MSNRRAYQSTSDETGADRATNAPRFSLLRNRDRSNREGGSNRKSTKDLSHDRLHPFGGLAVGPEGLETRQKRPLSIGGHPSRLDFWGRDGSHRNVE